MTNSKPNNVVLITGASTGFGREIALLLAQSNYRVYGTSRREMTGTPFTPLILDVRDDDSVRRCVDHVLAAQGRIDVLINNAGYLLSGLIEDVSIQEAKDQFETNFFGVHRVIQTVLPVMRKQRAGRIINISSLGGLVAAPGHGLYYASKFALEGYSESLANEVKSFNIHVTLVEPGYFKTNLHTVMVRASREIPDYARIRTPLFNTFKQGVGQGHDPRRVAHLVKNIIEKKSPKLRYQIGPGAHWIPFAKSILPQKLSALATRKFFHIPD